MRIRQLNWSTEPDELPRAETVLGDYVIWPHYYHVELRVGSPSFSFTRKRIQLEKGATLSDLMKAAQDDFEKSIAFEIEAQ